MRHYSQRPTVKLAAVMGALVLATFTVEPSLAAGETSPLLTQLKLIPTPGNTRLEGFGGSVAISGDIAIVGAAEERVNSGAAYVFSRNVGGPSAWGEIAKSRQPTAPLATNSGQVSRLAATRSSWEVHLQCRDGQSVCVSYGSRDVSGGVPAGCRVGAIWDPRVRQQSRAIPAATTRSSCSR
jgi:hypothetical protein